MACALLTASCSSSETAAPGPDATTGAVASPSPSPSPSPTPTSRAYRPLPEDLQLTWERVTEDVGHQLTSLTAPPDDPRLFVTAKDGRVWVIEDGRRLPEPFLDLRDEVKAGGIRSEQAMYSLAFHPDYADNGRLFVHYAARPDGDTRVVEFRVSEDDPDRADPEPAATILKVDQPHRWHNGGQIAFGPEGNLYVGLGDGGDGAADNGQDPSTLLGSILRLDIDAQGRPYAIPPDNPFAGGGRGAPEVWAYGLRNPWKFSFDPVEGLLYIAEVGEQVYEEIDVVAADEPGLNFGWAIREAGHCYPEAPCRSEGLEAPTVEYAHQENECAVVGGHVYDGEAIPVLAGHYLYTDFCAGWLRSFRLRDGEVVDEREWGPRLELPTALGTDAGGELYAVTSQGGVFRLARG